MSDPLPRHLRPITFAANELALDLIYLLQSYSAADLESIVILLCVTDATMRPFMQDPAVAAQVMTEKRPRDEIRGAISRRMIADKTGLSRELVRRKTQELAEAGLVLIGGDGRIRSAQRLDEPVFQRVVEDAHRAVRRYRERLESLGVSWDCVSP